MSNEAPSDSDASTLDPRTRRAQTEDMVVALRKAGGIYSVRGESGNVYRVDVVSEDCTCPDQRKTSTDRCKHLRRVEMEIDDRAVPTPDGRLPERPVADGGTGADKTSERTLDRRRIEGPIPEIDKFGQTTGVTYYRCSTCGTEAMQRNDLRRCCRVAGR